MNPRISVTGEIELWESILPDLHIRLPLRNVQKRAKNGSSITLPEMNFMFMLLPEEPIMAHVPPSDWHAKAYFHLYLIKSEDPDVYKKTISPKLRAWAEEMDRQDEEFLVVYVPPYQGGAKKNAMASLLDNIKSKAKKVMEQIKSDVGAKREQRVVKLVIGGGSNLSGSQIGASSSSNGGGLDLSASSSNGMSGGSSAGGGAGDDRAVDQWEDLLARMRDGVLSKLDQRLSAYDDEIHRLEEAKSRPDWSFCNYFAVKEGLAFTFEHFKLFSSALQVYDDLGRILDERKFLPSFYGLVREDDPCALDIDKATVRDKIHEGTACEFEVFQYLFARQIQLLFSAKKPTDAATMALSIIPRMSARMRRQSVQPMPHFNHKWSFTACLSTAQACRTEIAQNGYDSTVKEDLSGLIGDLYSFARDQLEKLASGHGLLTIQSQIDQAVDKLTQRQQASFSAPRRSSSSLLSASGSTPASPQPVPSIEIQNSNNSNGEAINLSDLKMEEVEDDDTAPGLPLDSPGFDAVIHPLMSSMEASTLTLDHPHLQKALNSQFGFEHLFMEITTAAAKNYLDGARHRFVVRLNGEIAAVQFLRGKYSDAEALFKGQLAVYKSERWTSLVHDIQLKLARCLLAMHRYSEYIIACLSLIEVSDITAGKRGTYFKEIANYAHSHITATLTRELTPMMRASVISPHESVKLAIGEDLVIQLQIFSTLPEKVVFDHATVELADLQPSSDPSRGKSEIVCHSVVVHPGFNSLEFKQRAVCIGEFAINSATLAIGRVHLRQSLFTDKNNRATILIEDSVSTLALEITSPPSLVVGQVQYLQMLIPTNLDTLETGFISISSPSGLHILDVADAQAYIYYYSSSSSKHDADAADMVSIDLDGNSNSAPLSLPSSASSLSLPPSIAADAVSTPPSAFEHSRKRRIVPAPIQRGKIRLPSCDAGETMEIFLPIRADSSSPCNHELTTRLEYLKKSRESFSYTKHFSFNFHVPFTVQTFSESMMRKVFAHVVVTSTAPTPIRISSYTLSHPDDVMVIRDHNAAMKNTVLLPRHKASFMFEFEHKGAVPKEDTCFCDFEMQFKSLRMDYHKSAQNSESPATLHNDPTVLIQKCTMAWKPPLIPHYEVEVKMLSKCSVAAFSPVEFVIRNTDDKKRTFTCEIVVDPACYMISGPNKKTCTIEAGGSQTIACRLLPIVPGNLLAPDVILHGVDAARVLVRRKSNRIVVIPNGNVAAVAAE